MHIIRRLTPKPIKQWIRKAIVDSFAILWYNSPNSWHVNTFLGHTIWQHPSDLQIYQELIYDLKPQFIIQTGVAYGGSILYFASILDMMGASPDVKVIGIDIQLTKEAKSISNPRVILIEGSSVDESIVNKVKEIASPGLCLLSFDSDHSMEHVYKEILAYEHFALKGSFMVVEDTIVNGHPVLRSFGPGPKEAVDKFLRVSSRFQKDKSWQRHLFSQHRDGWLKAIK